MQRKQILIILFIVHILSGCEYNLTETNYVEIEQPTTNAVLNLDLFSDSETINVFEKTLFTFDFSSDEFKFANGTLTLNEHSWNFAYPNGRFTIDPDKTGPLMDTLTLIITKPTGTGSIADIAGAEHYIFKKQWIIKIDDRFAPQVSLTKGITDEGFLKLTWPKCSQYNFEQYQLYISKFGVNKNIFLKNPNDTVYIDTSYVGGIASYNLSTHVHTYHHVTLGKTLGLNEPFPQMNFKAELFDKLTISWNKSKYKSHCILSMSGHEDVILDNLDTSYTIEHPGFGQIARFYLYTVPYYTNSTHTNVYDTYDYPLGERIAINSNDVEYNKTDKVLYTNTYNSFDCYDITTLTKQTSTSLSGYYSCPTNSSKVAALTSDAIYIYNDKNLLNPSKIEYNSYNIKHFSFTDNDLIAIVVSDKYELIDINSKEIVTTIDIEDSPVYSSWSCFSTSKDGKYACFVTLNGLKLYNIENGQANLIYSDNKAYRSAYFDIENPNQLILSLYYESGIEVRNVSDFSLLKSIELQNNSIIHSMDPETNYLLVSYNWNYLYVIDITSSEVLLKLRVSNIVSRINLFDSKLFSASSGYYLDISEALSK